MKILWICNIPIPSISQDMNEKEHNSGGWITGFANGLDMKNEIELHYCFPNPNIKKIKEGKVGNIFYYAYPMNRRMIIAPIMDDLKISKKIVYHINLILSKVKPDILHIFGTEFPHSLIAIRLFNNPQKTVINIQGLISIYKTHNYASLPIAILKNHTFSDMFRGNIIKQTRRMEKRGYIETEAIKNTGYVIGRTDWDKSCVEKINIKSKYCFCNEILRKEFYNHSWEFDKCEKYSLFFSQAWQPLKGLHYLIEALPDVINRFPKTKLYVAGVDLLDNKGIYNKLRKTSYANYIKKLIKKHKLEKYVIFTGPLNEKQMCEKFLKTHIFISSSTIENESNSVSEAKILGVPVIASFVGGVTNRILHKHDGFLYQHDAPYMLSFYICEIFSNEVIAKKFSYNGKKKANELYDFDNNINELINIYEIINSSN